MSVLCTHINALVVKTVLYEPVNQRKEASPEEFTISKERLPFHDLSFGSQNALLRPSPPSMPPE
eukprot:55459-Amphidinium_carterae.4